MKKILIIVSLIVTFFAHEVKAQKVETNYGFILSAQAEIALTETHGFTTSIPLFAALILKRYDFLVIPIYNLSGNSFGGFVKYLTPKEIGIYSVFLKKTESSDKYFALGVDVPSGNKIADIFIEIGGNHHHGDFEPALTIGFVLPIMLKGSH